MPHPSLTRILPFLALVLLSPPMDSQAQIPCTAGSRPAATLLFPYFEIDATDPDGKTTLISIRNASEEPTLAHVVVWSRCATPVLNFTLFLEGRGIQSINLRRLLVEGSVPVTGAEIAVAAFPGCSRPISVPELDGAAIAAILAALSGEAETCYMPLLDATGLTGFLTVDVLNDCSKTLRTPLHEGYFETGGTGLASNANVLVGDFMLIEGNDTSATFGFEAVSVVADAARFEVGGLESFYSPAFPDAPSGRLPLDTGYQARFLNGGGPGTRTEIIGWLNPFVSGHFFLPVFPTLDFFDERGRSAGSAFSVDLSTVFRIDTDDMMIYAPGVGGGPLDLAAGSLEIDFIRDECPVCSPPLFAPHQAWIAPLYAASGGLSVALRAIAQDGFCVE